MTGSSALIWLEDRWLWIVFWVWILGGFSSAAAWWRRVIRNHHKRRLEIIKAKRKTDLRKSGVTEIKTPTGCSHDTVVPVRDSNGTVLRYLCTACDTPLRATQYTVYEDDTE
jgi:hypothetical protein